MFSDSGPDVRWIGNEAGEAGTTCWSTVDPERVPHPGFDAPWVQSALMQGDPHGTVWRPGEADVSIRPGWFWHPDQDERVRSADNLMRLYFRSVGRNSKLLLNVPPTRDGLFHDRDVQALEAFDAKRRALFERDVLAGGRVRASGGSTSRRRARCRPRHPGGRRWHDDGLAGGGAARARDVRHAAAGGGHRARPAHRQPPRRRVARGPLADGGVGHDHRQRPAAQLRADDGVAAPGGGGVRLRRAGAHALAASSRRSARVQAATAPASAAP